MALTFDQLKAAFGKRATGGGSNENTGFWDRFYPFYKMNFGEEATFRFLPDADEENPLGFIVENKYHEFTINGKKKKIACLKMHDGHDAHCPACAASAKYYNELGDATMGKMFWRKVDYIGAGLVMHSPFDYPIKAEDNIVRLISIGPKLFKVIEAKVAKGDFDAAPYDMDNGYNFSIFKTKQGEYADYTTSDFARRSSPVPEALRSRIELVDLKKFRYARVDADAMQAQIEAFLTGKSYDDDRAGGSDEPDLSPKPSVVLSAATPATTAAPATADAAPAAEGGSASDRARALLARINKDRAPK